MEKFSASEKDKVLNQIDSCIRLIELNGDIDSNRLIVEELHNDGYIIVVKMMNDDMNNIWLTPKGESFKKRGGYKQLQKKERIEKIKKALPSIIKWLAGIFTAKILLALFCTISR